jgi:hypothetical protein
MKTTSEQIDAIVRSLGEEFEAASDYEKLVIAFVDLEIDQIRLLATRYGWSEDDLVGVAQAFASFS